MKLSVILIHIEEEFYLQISYFYIEQEGVKMAVLIRSLK